MSEQNHDNRSASNRGSREPHTGSLHSDAQNHGDANGGDLNTSLNTGIKAALNNLPEDEDTGVKNVNPCSMESIVVWRPARADEPFARRLFEQSIVDTFVQEGITDSDDEIAYEISHKSGLLRAALEAAEKVGEEDERCPTGVPSQPVFLIAEYEGEIVGTISFGPCGEKIRELTEGRLNGIGELGSLYIRPDYQNRGIGSRLIGAVMAELRARGIERFCLDSGYRRAQKRWRRKFGEPYIWIEDYWGLGEYHAIWYCRVDDME